MKEYFLEAKDVSELLNIAVSTAYKVMQDLNDELKRDGYITISGKVSKKYFYKRMKLTVK